MTSLNQRWRDTLYAEVRKKPNRLFITLTPDRIVPIGSIWSGTRQWKNALQEAGLQAGDRILIEAVPCPTFINILVASLWDGYTLCPVAPGANLAKQCEALDPKLILSPNIQPWNEQGGYEPGTELLVRDCKLPVTPDARFILQTSGTTGTVKRIAITDEGIWANLDAHRPELAMEGLRVASLLPWHHAFGLILDLLPALLDAKEIIRISDFGRDMTALVLAIKEHDLEYLSCVPLTAQKLADHPYGPDILRNLQGGIIGGATVNAPLCSALSDTRLRVGYGQTEASPGILLGQPGEWAPQFLGRPCGTEVSIADDGELLFRGKNQCLGFWEADRGLTPMPKHSWVHTGDIIHVDGDQFFYRGRKKDWFKLDNGRGVPAGQIENELKSQHTGVDECFLTTADHQSLSFFYSGDASEAAIEASMSVLLKSVKSRLEGVHHVSEEEWHFTPKGSLDRAATQAALTLHHAPCP